MATSAAAVMQHYAWRNLAGSTVEVYRIAMSITKAPADDPRHRGTQLRHGLGVPHLVAPLGLLMDVGR